MLSGCSQSVHARLFAGRLGALAVVLMIAGNAAPEKVRCQKEDMLVG